MFPQAGSTPIIALHFFLCDDTIQVLLLQQLWEKCHQHLHKWSYIKGTSKCTKDTLRRRRSHVTVPTNFYDDFSTIHKVWEKSSYQAALLKLLAWLSALKKNIHAPSVKWENQDLGSDLYCTQQLNSTQYSKVPNNSAARLLFSWKNPALHFY